MITYRVDNWSINTARLKIHNKISEFEFIINKFEL